MYDNFVNSTKEPKQMYIIGEYLKLNGDFTHMILNVNTLWEFGN